MLTPDQEALCHLMALLDTHVPDEHNQTGEFLCAGVCPGCGLWQVEYVVYRDKDAMLDIPYYLWTAELVQGHRLKCEPFAMLAGLAEMPQLQAANGRVDVLAYLRDTPQP